MSPIPGEAPTNHPARPRADRPLVGRVGQATQRWGVTAATLGALWWKSERAGPKSCGKRNRRPDPAELSYPVKMTGPGEKLMGKGGTCWRASGSAKDLENEKAPHETKCALSQNLHGLVELPGKPPQPEGTGREHQPPSSKTQRKRPADPP